MSDTPPFPAVPQTRHRLLRGSNEDHDAFVGMYGELTYDTTNKTARVHDGETLGGFVLSKEGHEHTLEAISDLPKPDIENAGKFLQVSADGSYGLADTSTSTTTESIIDASPLGRTLMRAADSQIVREVLGVDSGLPKPTVENAGKILQIDDSGAFALAVLPPGVPSGFIGMWSGAANVIPSGWLLCDGTNGTPDLRNRFIIGAGSTYAPKAVGGATSAITSTAGAHAHNITVAATTLAEGHMASHAHGAVCVYGGNQKGLNDGQNVMYINYSGTSGYTGSNWGHNHTASADAQGNHTHTVTTLPPYYALCFIMKA